jgi:hypothetical protein
MTLWRRARQAARADQDKGGRDNTGDCVATGRVAAVRSAWATPARPRQSSPRPCFQARHRHGGDTDILASGDDWANPGTLVLCADPPKVPFGPETLTWRTARPSPLRVRQCGSAPRTTRHRAPSGSLPDVGRVTVRRPIGPATVPNRRRASVIDRQSLRDWPGNPAWWTSARHLARFGTLAGHLAALPRALVAIASLGTPGRSSMCPDPASAP